MNWKKRFRKKIDTECLEYQLRRSGCSTDWDEIEKFIEEEINKAEKRGGRDTISNYWKAKVEEGLNLKKTPKFGKQELNNFLEL